MINPEFLNELGFAMAEVYAACTDRLLVNLARHFKYLKEDEKPGGAFDYQARKLAEFGQINRESVEIIQTLMDGADAALKDCLEAAIVDALEDLEPELKRAAVAGLLNQGAVPPVVSPRVTQTFRMYYEQSADKLNLVNTSMLESTENAYRATVSDITARMQRQQSILNAATGQAVTGVESFNRALKLATDKMVENGITGFVDHAGRQWSPEAYVAMDMRSTFHNVSRRAFWERNEEYANDLYLVSQHPGARPLCYPWQCKVISRLNKRRWEKDGAGNPVQVWAQNETSFGEPAGLFGINCGHHPMLFIPGATKIPELMQNEKQNAKQYAESQKQRSLERELRAARLKLEVEKARGADKETVKAAREGVKRASEKLDEFCDETGRKRRREREYAPVKATWPDPKSYGDSPTAVRDALRDYFGNGGVQSGL